MTAPNVTADVLAAFTADASRDAALPFVDVAAAYLAAAGAGEGRVFPAASAEQLAARFDEPLPRSGLTLHEVAARLARDVVADANRLHHPMYVGHQIAGPLPAATWAEVVIAALNQSVAVREMSPTVSAVEHRVVRWMADLAGLGPRAGGTFTSGGTEATFAALLAARSRAIPDVWTLGVGATPPAIVCGEHAHYAVSRAAGEMGLGLDAVARVPSRDYRMDVDALEETLGTLARAGRRVMAVVATAGSTATGSFDDLDAIADRCEARGIWLHVDGAHGASALLAPAHAGRLRGLHRAHSIAWDPHKMLLLPMAAGVVLVRDERWLEAAFAQHAPYLFASDAVDGGDPTERTWDQGVRSFQCSRRGDAVKLWVALQRYGADGLGALYAHLCETTRALHARLDAHPAFEPLHAPECNILCFRWVGVPNETDDGRLDLVNARARARYNASGDGWVTATVLGGRRVLRATVMNPRTTREHLARLVEGLDAAARVEWEALESA